MAEVFNNKTVKIITISLLLLLMLFMLFSFPSSSAQVDDQDIVSIR